MPELIAKNIHHTHRESGSDAFPWKDMFQRDNFFGAWDGGVGGLENKSIVVGIDPNGVDRIGPVFSI